MVGRSQNIRDIVPNLIRDHSRLPAREKHFFSKWKPREKWISCELKNVIYCITCKKCQAQYIGETGRPIRQRIYEISIPSPEKMENQLRFQDIFTNQIMVLQTYPSQSLRIAIF
jgi:hypothetical protein